MKRAKPAGGKVLVKGEPTDHAWLLEQQLKYAFQWQFKDAGEHIAKWLKQFSPKQKKAMLVIGKEDDDKPSYSVSGDTVTKVQNYLGLILAPKETHYNDGVVEIFEDSDDEQGSGTTNHKRSAAAGASARKSKRAAGGAAAAAGVAAVVTEAVDVGGVTESDQSGDEEAVTEADNCNFAKEQATLSNDTEKFSENAMQVYTKYQRILVETDVPVVVPTIKKRDKNKIQGIVGRYHDAMNKSLAEILALAKWRPQKGESCKSWDTLFQHRIILNEKMGRLKMWEEQMEQMLQSLEQARRDHTQP